MADQEPHLANSGPAEEASPQQPASLAPPPAEGANDQASVMPEADVLFPVAAPAESAGASAAAEEPQLPDRIRVHALAKMLGVTSKRILAQLSELGSGARSAQSSLDRAVAETVRDSLAAPAGVASAPSPETSAPSSDSGPANEPAAAAAVPPAAPAFAAPAASHLFASPVQDAAHVMEPVSFMAVADAPLFLPPAPVAGAIDKAEPGEDAGTDADADNDTDDQSARRRRRGRRGRGRGRGETGAENTDDDAVAAPAATGETIAADGTADQHEADTAGESEDDENDGEGATRRRRRRRRRKVSGEASESGGEASEDDPPNTVVHEREPRTKSRARDEVQGIAGSTRLEAKRQRRRDGRDAGRRRPPILTESEFLARRESVDRVMVVREKSFAGVDGAPQAPITQVAVLEDNVLVEHFVTSTTSASMVGNIYLGRVQNVLPSMEAAFVDIGRGRNGVLYAGEVNWEAAGLGGKERKIEQALKPGDQVLVQVSKDPVGHKGARLTTQISLAGRFLVYVPDGSSTGISRKLPDTERKRLKEILREIVPADAGVIIRTASEGVSEAELTRDVERLQATWAKIQDADKNSGSAPQTLYEEPDLLVKVVRDLFNEDFSKLVVEGDRAWDIVEGYVKMVAPDMLSRVERHQHESLDVFTVYRIDEQLAKALDRKVWLPSGGTLVIDRTEAMTVVDVNTGKFTGSGGNLEETVTRNNLEAAEEIVRQMRLRDIGGMIVVDFIDMVLESNRDLVLRRLTEALGRDRTRHQVSEVTSLGLVQMTRKKLGTGLVEAFSTTCTHCAGRGLIVHEYPVESPPEEEQAPKAGRERKRRGKDKADRNGAAPAEPEEHQAEDASAKRAHPVALAMAAHHGEEHEPETSVPDLGALDPAGPEGDPAVDSGQGNVGEVAQQAPAAAAEPKRRARRRVARAVSAPANEHAGEVIVVPVAEAPAAPIVVPAAPVAVPPRRPRRRAVGRPAGPPAEDS